MKVTRRILGKDVGHAVGKWLTDDGYPRNQSQTMEHANEFVVCYDWMIMLRSWLLQWNEKVCCGYSYGMLSPVEDFQNERFEL